MASPEIAYLFTTFPKPTETFLQREVAALRAQGANLRLYSLWGGGKSFRGLPVQRFAKWRLLLLVVAIPREAWRHPGVLRELLRGLASRRAPSWINFWENMLGAAFACLAASSFRRRPPALIHAVWGGGPATAAWLLWRLDGHKFSAAAHAYDLYENGGDWWLMEKLSVAAFVHTSTEMGRRALIERGLPPEKAACIRRGLEQLPALKPLRASRSPLRLVSVARLVEKKGLGRQLRIYAELRAAGIAFTARLVGEGPLRPELERLAGRLGVAADVTFTGHLSQHEVWSQLAQADVLLHTGVIAPSGDRDGLPNVIPEAMAAGVLVVSSPAAATTEAVADGVTGLIAPVDAPAAWVEALRRLAEDDVLAERLRRAARQWVEENFSAQRNAARLAARFEAALTPVIYYDVTKSAGTGHRSGLMRVNARLREELGQAVETVGWGSWDRAGPGDWILTTELFSEAENPGLGEFLRGKRGRAAAVYYDSIPLKHPAITWPRSVARHPGYLKLLAGFDRVWAISAASRDELAGIWRWMGIARPPPIEVLTLGADFNRRPRVRRDGPPSAPSLLSIGILEPRKNQLFLLEVCETLWAEGLAFELHLVGRPNPRFGAPILRRIKALARSRALRHHAAATDAEVAALYARARAGVFPTRAEGCGLPVLESLWQGVPCVCSDLPVLRENADGGGCLPLALDDREAWAAGLRRILTDESLCRRLEAEAAARSLPTWAEAAQTILAGLRGA